MTGIHNANARLGMAVDALATLSKSLRERLIYAASHIINDMKAEDMPRGDLRSEYESLAAFLTRLPPQPPSDGQIQATVRAMTDAEAEETARRIVALTREVAEETWRLNLKTASASGRK
ncbi:MAG: hypothetical protein ACMG6H_03065 [Acidobacteriota bacterium]